MPNTDSVQRYWDKNAKAFDQLYGTKNPLSRAFNAVFRRALVARLRIAGKEIRAVGDATVLDVGCGSGRTSIPLARAGAAKHITGVDFAPHMIEMAERAAADAGVADRCTFKVQDFMAKEFDERFDVVSALGVFDYVAEPVPFLKRMLEIAKKKAVFSVPKPSLVRGNLRKIRYGRHGVTVHFYTHKELQRLGKEAGAKTTTIHRMPAGYTVVCEPG